MDCACLFHKIRGYYKKEFAYSSSDRQLDGIAENGSSVLHEDVYIRKVKLQKTLENSEI